MSLINSSRRTLRDEFLDEIVSEVFTGTPAGRKIAQELSYKDLKNMTTIKVMAPAANFELNRRFRVLHYRNGEINPPFLRKFWKISSQTNLTNDKIKWEFEKHHWLPSCAILFGNQQPLNIMDERVPIDYVKIKGDPMNGMFFPYAWHWNDNLYFSDIRALMLKYGRNIEFSKRLKITQIRENQYSMPICVVAQSNIGNKHFRKEIFDQDHWNSIIRTDNLVMTFRGFNMDASTFVVDIEDDETLKRQFLDWKEVNIIAVTKKKSDIFQNIPLSTLRLHGGPSTTGVSYHTETESRFDAGPVYAIVGLRMFGCDRENRCKENG
ncbi:unnamed protein product [Onchocerca flexuosa]|uniref:Uncharacterized protein n=1 Tax=Onchocerca flexuosa TaxID=387005 RepID=A0A183I4X1_9BILA|nr:unnamed protein product [Onchocerca flexuosa]